LADLDERCCSNHDGASDKNNDQKLSKVELTSLADTWYDKLDLTRPAAEQGPVTQRLDVLLLPENQTNATPIAANAGANPNPNGGTTLRTGFIGAGIFTAADGNKDGSVTRPNSRTLCKVVRSI